VAAQSGVGAAVCFGWLVLRCRCELFRIAKVREKGTKSRTVRTRETFFIVRIGSDEDVSNERPIPKEQNFEAVGAAILLRRPFLGQRRAVNDFRSL